MALKLTVVFLALCAVGAFGGHLRAKRAFKDVAYEMMSLPSIRVCLTSGNVNVVINIVECSELMFKLNNIRLADVSKVCSMSEMLDVYYTVDKVDICIKENGGTYSIKNNFMGGRITVADAVKLGLTDIKNKASVTTNLTSKQCNCMNDVISVQLPKLLTLFEGKGLIKRCK